MAHAPGGGQWRAALGKRTPTPASPFRGRDHSGGQWQFLNNTALITLYGGSGFIGRHVVRAIAKTGASMRVAVRRPELAGHLQPLGGVGQIVAVQANVRYPDSLLAAADGADAVINLVGILFPTGKQTFKAVQDEGARHVAEAARKAGAPRSCMSRRSAPIRNAPSVYARTKAEGEKAVAMSSPGRSSCALRSCSGRRTTSSTASPRWRGSRPRFR